MAASRSAWTAIQPEMGHSFGGGVAGEIARVDARVRASVHFDAFYQEATSLIQLGMGKPLLYTYTTESRGTQILFNKAQRDAYSLQIRDTRHADLGDNGAWVDRANESARLGAVALNNCMLSFLKKYLKDQDDRLLENPSAQYPHVINFVKR